MSPNPKKRFGSREGVTLVEVLIASSMMLAVFGGSFAMITQSTAILRQARDHYVATTICVARVERGRDFDYNLLTFLEEDDFLVDQDGVPTQNGRFRRTTTVSVNSPDVGVTTIRVRTDIRDLKSGDFKGAHAEINGAFTVYLTAPPP